MTLAAPPGITLRPYLPQDLMRLSALTRAAIMVLAADDYDADQRAAWAAGFEDEAQLGGKLETYLVLIAEADEAIAGYIALKDNAVIELLYVAPGHERRGVATFLVGAIELLARGRSAATLTVRASDTAGPVFARLGYEPSERNSVSLGGEWLANTTMKKALAAEATSRAQ